MKKEGIVDKIIDKILNIFLSKDKTHLYVLGAFVLGFILRFIATINLPTTIDASGHALMAYNFISSGKLATWNQSVGLWYFLTDLAYKIFGINDVGARFTALIFGSLSVIAIFLIVKEFFGKRAGIIAAFLLAISPFHIAETLPEMDVTSTFFILISLFLFIKSLKQDKKTQFILSGIFIGIAILIKIYAVLFIPAFLVYALYYYKKYKPNKKILIKNLVLFGICAFIFCLVPLIYNYLLYQDKGFVDYIFTGILEIGKEKSDQYYSWVVPYKHDYINFFIPGQTSKIPLSIYYLKEIGRGDIVIILFGILGIILSLFRKNKDYLFLFLCSMIAVYFYMGSMVFLMIKHYVFLLALMVPFAAFSINKISRKIKWKHALVFIFILIFLFQLLWINHYTGGQFYEKSSMNEVVDYKQKISENALVIWDSRIFRGIGTYLFMDKHYIEANYFSDLMITQSKLPSQTISTEVYFIECVDDDCGWGTIKDQPEFNQTMEQITETLKTNTKLVESVIGGGDLSYSYNIYKGVFQLKQGVLDLADSTHLFWVNPVGYDKEISEIFDDYEAKGALNKTLDKFAHLVMYSAVLFSILSGLILFYYLFKEKKSIKRN